EKPVQGLARAVEEDDYLKALDQDPKGSILLGGTAQGKEKLMSLKTVRDMEGCFGFDLRWVHARLGAVAKARFDTHHLEEYAQTSAVLEKATSAD
ncbi:hypothetical protein Tco_0591596, partial [Tanacetum coccineum]